MGCQGCTLIEKPFWGDACPVKSCCEERGHEHCGQCLDFPCGLLNEFAYDEKQGDNGKRIETCRLWFMKERAKEKSFDADKFILDVAKQNAESLKGHFAADAIICWHDSNEQLTVPEYIRANCEYPGRWSGEVRRVEIIDDGIVIVASISSSESKHFVTSFIRLTNGKISQLDEHYSDCGEVPGWRQEMNIGKPIE